MIISEENEAHFQYTLHRLAEEISRYSYRTAWARHNPKHADDALRHRREITTLASRIAGLIVPEGAPAPGPGLHPSPGAYGHERAFQAMVHEMLIAISRYWYKLAGVGQEGEARHQLAAIRSVALKILELAAKPKPPEPEHRAPSRRERLERELLEGLKAAAARSGDPGFVALWIGLQALEARIIEEWRREGSDGHR